MLQTICVFCGSNRGSRDDYAATAVQLVRYLVAENIGIVYGGGNVGLMGILADTALSEGGRIVGVIPDVLVAKERLHRGLKDVRIVRSMHERKALMAELADAFIALPGGYGTFEEFCEVLTWTQLGLHRKACGLLNVAGFYDPLLQMFDHAAREGFLHSAHRDMVLSDSRPDVLVERLRQYQVPSIDKWLVSSQAS